MVKTDVVLFFSPSCPFCNAFYRDLMTAVKDGAFSLSGKRVTIIMFSRNAADVSASKNLLCVGHLSFPAAYHEYQSTTFRRFYGRTYESGWAEKTSASIAVKYGATPESLLRCQSDLKLQAVVSLFHKVGSSYSQTLPFVLINGKKAPIDEFRRLRRELS